MERPRVPVEMAVKVGDGNVWARVRAEQRLHESSKVLRGLGGIPSTKLTRSHSQKHS